VLVGNSVMNAALDVNRCVDAYRAIKATKPIQPIYHQARPLRIPKY